MYLSMHVFVHVYVHAYVHAYVHVYVYVHPCLSTSRLCPIYVCVGKQKCMRMRKFVRCLFELKDHSYGSPVYA